MRILLVSPADAGDFLSHSIEEVSYLGARAFFAPHAIAAVAALTPRKHVVELHDEALQGSVVPRIARDDFDVVGISLRASQMDRAVTIGRAFRQMNRPGTLVVGGFGTSYMLPQLVDLVDTVFLGEAEETWPEYLDDLGRGEPRATYRRVTKPDMAKVPAPRWELIADDIPAYMAASVQTTRGCRFDCSFCDVIYTFGRRPRSKTIDQVLDEIGTLKSLGVRMVYLADDNFCVNRKQTKELLRRLAPMNNAFDEPLGFITQVDITIARDEELLELLADCNFNELQIGIESSSADALDDLNKKSNTGVDLVEAVRKIQSYGMLVMAHMIIGADSDDRTAFARTRDFLEEANIILNICHPLAAPPGTRLWYQLKRAGRIIPQLEPKAGHVGASSIDVQTNIIPKGMTREELLQGIVELWRESCEPDAHYRRVRRFLDGITRPPQVAPAKPAVLWKMRGLLIETARHFITGPSKAHRGQFFDNLGRAGRLSPALVPKIIFAHAGFLMDRARVLHSAEAAEAQIRWEREHPEELRPLPTTTPLPPEIRTHARAIFEPAYLRIREKTDNKEKLYQAVIDAMVDYTDRYGGTFSTMDEQQLAFVNDSCDRILTSFENGDETLAGQGEPLGDAPPAGFVREILDMLDHSLRMRTPA